MKHKLRNTILTALIIIALYMPTAYAGIDKILPGSLPPIGEPMPNPPYPFEDVEPTSFFYSFTLINY